MNVCLVFHEYERSNLPYREGYLQMDEGKGLARRISKVVIRSIIVNIIYPKIFDPD